MQKNNHETNSNYTLHNPPSSIQTMLFALHKKSLTFLIEDGFFANKEVLDKSSIILKYEIGLSQKLIAKGWNIKCLLPEYNIDYRKPHTNINPCVRRDGGLLCYCGYFGRTLHPYEVMFIKTNWNLVASEYLDMLTLSALHKKPNPNLLQLANIRTKVRESIEKRMLPLRYKKKPFYQKTIFIMLKKLFRMLQK